MNKTIYFIIGNGFSINLVEKLGLEKKIDLQNLFAKGDEVLWPGDISGGFLSKKYCNNLWTLGARTTMSNIEANQFIADLITCYNVYNTAQIITPSFRAEKANIYKEAHNELSTYLKHLFIYYNSKISDKVLKELSKTPVMDLIRSEKAKGSNIVIITYNYDIFLERLLQLNGIRFGVYGFSRSMKDKVRVLKPHGSISFVSKRLNPIGKKFDIKDTFDSMEMPITSLKLDYLLIDDRSLINAIIPPAGDANRLAIGWTKYLRSKLKEEIAISSPEDELIIYGLSYDYVDRMEIDEILTTINSEIEVKYVDPYPSKTLGMVLGSIFKNYIHLKSADLLRR